MGDGYVQEARAGGNASVREGRAQGEAPRAAVKCAEQQVRMASTEQNSAFDAQQLWLREAELVSSDEEAEEEATPPPRGRRLVSRYDRAGSVMGTPDRLQLHSLQQQLQARATRPRAPTSRLKLPIETPYVPSRHRAFCARGYRCTSVPSALRRGCRCGARACCGYRRRSTRFACADR